MSILEIRESINLIDNLEYLNLGFYNFVFLDKELNCIIKVPKTIAITKNRLYNIININKDQKTYKPNIILKTQESIIEYLDSINIHKSQKSQLIKSMLKHMELASVVNTLPTFLHFKGFIVYNNIGSHGPNSIDITPLIVEAFEFLPKLDTVNIPNKKDYLLSVINDFKKYNNNGYYHNDLQENCRNITSYLEGETRKLKVIDLDDSKKITDLIVFSDIKLDKLQLLFKDYISLVKCLAFQGVITDSEKQILITIDYSTLFTKLADKRTNTEKVVEIKTLIDNLYKKLIDKVTSINGQAAGNYYNKYLKYKEKYLLLQQKLSLQK